MPIRLDANPRLRLRRTLLPDRGSKRLRNRLWETSVASVPRRNLILYVERGMSKGVLLVLVAAGSGQMTLVTASRNSPPSDMVGDRQTVRWDSFHGFEIGGGYPRV